MLAASPAAECAQAPLVPATHLGAPGAVTTPTSGLGIHPALTYLSSSGGHRECDLQEGNSLGYTGAATRSALSRRRTWGCSRGLPALRAAATAPPATRQLSSPELTAEAPLSWGLVVPPPCVTPTHRLITHARLVS